MTMIKLYMTPGSCSTGIHILLEEADEIFEVHLVNLMKGDQFSADYQKLNPKGTVPTLTTPGGDVFTDFISVAWWIGRNYPNYGWIPQDPIEEARTLEVLSYAVNTVHGQGYTRVFTPEKYQFDGVTRSAIENQGKAMVIAGMEWLGRCIKGEPYVGHHFGVADVALFYCEFWAKKIGLTLPDTCSRHLEAMLRRPKVQGVLIEEGYGAWVQQELRDAIA